MRRHWLVTTQVSAATRANRRTWPVSEARLFWTRRAAFAYQEKVAAKPLPEGAALRRITVSRLP